MQIKSELPRHLVVDASVLFKKNPVQKSLESTSKIIPIIAIVALFVVFKGKRKRIGKPNGPC